MERGPRGEEKKWREEKKPIIANRFSLRESTMKKYFFNIHTNIQKIFERIYKNELF